MIPKMATSDKIHPACFQKPLYVFSFSCIKNPENKFGAKLVVFYGLSVGMHKLLLA
jgi:hypothetical protein